jgi:hypothetical protein
MKMYAKLITAGVVLCVPALVSLAEWVLIQDFEDVTYDDFDLFKRFPPQGDLFLSGYDPDDVTNGHYYCDPGLEVSGANNQVWNGITLPAPVEEGQVATIKFDLYFFSMGPYNLNIGLSTIPVTVDDSLTKENGQLLAPSEYDAFESQAAFTVGNFQFRSGADFAYADTLYPVRQWFTMYYVIDNGADRTYFYYKTSAMATPVHIPLPESDYASFRNGATDPLVTWIIAAAGSKDGLVDVFLLDNLYIDLSGVNLDGGTHVGETGYGFWAGYPLVDMAGNADTGGWLGWINAADPAWIYLYNLAGYVYLPEAFVNPAGSWAYVPAN